MKKLIEVEQARALMTEAIDWSVMKWLTEKKRVRKVADKANEILDAVEKEFHDSWSDDFKAAYEKSGIGSPEIQKLAKRIREKHEAALRLRADAEETFDRAEKRLSTAIAREGCDKAIQGWKVHLEAIAEAEAAAPIRR
jgi:hypothetical protein